MIGLFDSGSGGLAALRAIREGAPKADLVYFADEANLPYGEKTEEELISLARAAIHRLLHEGAEYILAACGTASSVALPTLARECPVPLYGILDPTAMASARAWRERGGRILVLGTRATVEKGALTAKIGEFATHAPTLSLACPDFVTLSEAYNSTQKDEREQRIRASLSPVLSEEVGVVVLGCTHFSRLGEEIGACFPRAAVVDGATEAAQAMLDDLPPAALHGSSRTILRSSGRKDFT